MRPLKFFVTVFLLVSALHLNAQNGIIRGTIFDETLGEPMISVTVMAEGTTTGTVSDLDGKFNLTIAPGTYNLKLSFISYESLVVSGVTVKAGGVTLLENLSMKSSTIGLSEVTVTASMVRNTENAIMSIKMNSPTVMDGISSAGFRKIGDSDAASSMKRVTGVSVEGGKYVYVRGLGDRYTKTILNGVDLPGLDPDRNTMQMDIFPTNIIDNIMVYKSFSAELPADFTGGVVDIGLKDFPDQKKGVIFINTAYNPDFHFQRDYLSYKGGKTDFLGFDDGTRSIPAISDIPFFTDVVGKPVNSDASLRFREILEGFNPNMAAMKQMSLADYGFGASFGNQVPYKKATLGYNFGFSYKSNTEFYEDAEYGRYGLAGDPDVTEMEVREFQKGNFGVSSVLLSGLAGFAVKTLNAKYRINLMHLQNGESKAGIFDYIGSDQGSNFEGFQHNLEYSERGLTNLLIDGKHSFKGSDWDIIWKLSPTVSKIEDPDARFVRYIDENEVFLINTESGFPERIWRDLSETNMVGLVHASKGFNFNGAKAKLNFGGAYTYKERDFIINKYALNIRNIPLTGNPDELFLSQNLWPYMGVSTSRGTTYEANFIPVNPNQFHASSSNTAGYLSTEFRVINNLKAVAGIRIENYIQRYTGQDQLGINVLNNDKVIDNLDFFPTLNLIYSLSEKQNIRVSYAKTTARPSFKEMSYAEISDPISGRTFIGGMFRDADDGAGIEYWDGNLVSSDINNFDLRWEMFHGNGQMVSLSGFYKSFINPIEIVQYATQTGSFQPRNVGDGKVLGVEVELRQGLDIINQSLSNFSLIANMSFTNSTIELSATEYVSKVENARTGETIDKYRVMAGQAPSLINGGLAYNGGTNGFWKGLEAGLYYNVQGSTLQYVGIADRPDIYMLPFHSLNFNASKFVGKNNRTQIGFKIDNLLDDKKESVFKSFSPTDQFFTKLEPGITFQFKLSYSLF
ncbi:MAG: hypothetical protein A2X05_13380 [Bacteroidetes bacterium GWE2_41_25]|nr:MAG: hypothetical protein A2X03_14240 [Bacteroidetes bacterium GWA2_40_15]OFX91002.1 MAG: hypothetical protein A2X06_04195 [Bacteroidetes bacterium GWC2_40_22]OFY13368.1 MAG: hypothetical protein A2X05_13380 [Bacteroidetes bacterium GWE2_41_25]OFY61956.1 MAG: hypothetical protein A2X04_03150 [Bacteroidetes bacterium GWF2_41_9]HBH85558.1 hypothetical protein [Bacteroidales bacterium]